MKTLTKTSDKRDLKLRALHAQTPAGKRLTCREIARQTGFTESGVSSAAARGVAKLRAGCNALIQEGFTLDEIAQAFRELFPEP